MTCIVGIASAGKVYVGADSAGVDTGRYALTVRADRKVFRNGEFIMGFTSSFRMGQLLAFAFNPPKPREGVDLFTYMVTDFVNAARDCLKLGGYASRVNEEERGGEFLVGCRGRIFRICSDYQVAENSSGYDACGCGDLIALGSLFSTSHLDDPNNRISEALTAAERFSAGVRGPFHIEVTA